MRRILIVSALLLLVPALAPAAQAQAPPPPAPPTPPAVIAAGVSAGGTDLSGLTLEAAAQKLYVAHAAILGQPIYVHAGGRRFTLWMRKLDLAFDVHKTAARAFRAGAKAKGKPVDVKLSVAFARKRVAAFAHRVAKRSALAPRDATLRITLTRVVRRPSRPGRAVPEAPLVERIAAAVVDSRVAREFKAKTTKLRPKVTTRDVRRRSRTVLTIDRDHFRLRLFKGGKLAKAYPVAVGQPAYPTPTGLYSIVNKQVNPVWSVPNSPWAGELAGTTVTGGSAANPLKARWMGIVNGVGIHGTGEDASIGTRASHGCIRMHVRDVVDLYPRVPIGTPVLIA
jgi:lipoprotein-anchoring transpeptidase ErfK/SrfK